MSDQELDLSDRRSILQEVEGKWKDEERALSRCKMWAENAISSLDKAFSYMDIFGGIEELNSRHHHPNPCCNKEELLDRLQSLQQVCDERRQILTIIRRKESWLTEGRNYGPIEFHQVSRFINCVHAMEGDISIVDFNNPTRKFLKAKIAKKLLRVPPLDSSGSLAQLAQSVQNLWVNSSELFLRLHAYADVVLDFVSPCPEHRCYPATEDILGREREKEQILQWLLKQPAETASEIVSGDHISLFAILGVAGMGKTALAKLAYSDPSVSISFDYLVWVQVPCDFATETITNVIMKEVTTMSPEYYTSKFLQHALTGKKLLLVLDDVWEDNCPEKWQALVATLKNCERGSRILLTTRMQSVVDMAADAVGAAAECLRLNGLDENDNLMLFNSRLPSKVFSQDYAHLLLIGEQIAESTGGCPFVTQNVASWLGSHMETGIWNAVLHDGWQKMGFMDCFASFLSLSYYHLPIELQFCFLYCSIFPKGHKFNKVELASMWVCSGLIRPSPSNKGDFGVQKKRTPAYLAHQIKRILAYRKKKDDSIFSPHDIGLQEKEDADLFSALHVGEQYFDALVRKSFFCCMVETEPFSGCQKEYYVLHSLMHDMVEFVPGYVFARGDNADCGNVMPTTRHLFIAHCSSLRGISHLTHLRTLVIQSEFCLDQEVELALGEILQNNKCLRLLYLDVPSLSHALDRISDLTHLRYLFLFSCDESHIHSVFKLYHLQVFKLSYFTPKKADLHGICNLRSLRCLHVPGSMLSMIHQVGRLNTLQELHGFEIVENDGHRLCSLGNLTDLHRLSLGNLQNVRNCEEVMEIKLKDKHHMRFLSLSWNKHLNNLDNLDNQIIDSLEPNKEIQQMHINGYNGVRLPIWIENPSLIHLVSLDLEYCMNWKTLPTFQDLSSLKYLKLEHLFQLEYIGPVIEEQFETNESENTCLPPFLNTLIIRWCPSLKKLPALPCTLEQLIVKHVGLAVLPIIHHRYIGRWESSSSSSLKSCLGLLHIESCTNLTSLDVGLLEEQEHLQSLETLLVRHCERLSHLPAKGFVGLHHLNFLEIIACPMLRDAKSKGSLLPISLKNLDINPCGHIEVSFLMSLHNLTSLRRLTLFSCSNIEKLPSEELFRTLRNLNDVSIARCNNLLSLGGLGAAASLRVLSILCCNKLNSACSPQDSATCSFKLYKLKVDRQALLLVEPLKSLTYTMELHVGDDYAMESLPEDWLLQNATSLCSIEMGAADNLHSLPSQMENLKLLQSLHINRAPLIESLPKLPASLIKLTIWGCDPMFLKCYEKDVGSDWNKIAHISHVDMKAYSEGTSYNDDQIQYFNDSTSNPPRQFAVID